MAGGRNSPALFELIREKSGMAPPAAPKPPAPAVPAPVATVEAAPLPKRPPPPPKAAEPAAAPMAQPSPLDSGLYTKPGGLRPGIRQVSVSTTTLGFALAAVLLVIVVVWATAYRRGFKNGEDGVTKDLGSSAAPLNDPLKNKEIPVNPKLIGDAGKGGSVPQPKQEARKTVPAAAGPVPAQPSSSTPTAFGTDPRVVGQNYLVLAAKIDRETAERVIAFFKDNGVELFVLPVAKSGGGANNPGPCALYARQGLPPEMIRSKSPEWSELQDKVHRLGKVWQKEHKGQTDFSQTYWEKKKP